MANFLAWSHSRLKQFLECPKQLYHCAVARKGHPDRVDYVETVEKKAGNMIDDALTKRIGQGEPLPMQYQHWEDVAALCEDAPGASFTQHELALDQTGAPCGSMEWDRVWVRIKLDYLNLQLQLRLAHAIDWKNGKPWLDEGQLRLYALGIFHYYQEIDVVKTAYGWLKTGKIDTKTYHRRDLNDMWRTFLPDVERYQMAYTNSHYPAAPSRGKASCQWCPVNAQGKCPVALDKYKGK